jgi:hypothetical protein
MSPILGSNAYHVTARPSTVVDGLHVAEAQLELQAGLGSSVAVWSPVRSRFKVEGRTAPACGIAATRSGSDRRTRSSLWVFGAGQCACVDCLWRPQQQ